MNPAKGFVVDHINGNGLDNRRENLRISTQAQNLWNAKKHKDSSSIYKGVSKRRNDTNWSARIMKNGKAQHIGMFTTETEAASAYNRVAKELFGEFAILNTVD